MRCSTMSKERNLQADAKALGLVEGEVVSWSCR